MKEKDKRHKRSSSQLINAINQTPAPIAVLIGVFVGLVLARLWFGPVRTILELRLFAYTAET